MNDRICLRCDWEGQTKARTCPSCGATLFRPAGTGPARRRRLPSWRRSSAGAVSGPSAAPGAETFDAAASSVSDPLGAPPASGRGGWITGAVVVFIAVIVIAVVQRSTPPPEPVAPAPGLQGDLLYASAEGETESRLWIWNLATGELRRGPTVPHPVELVDLYLADPEGGWVGVTSVVGDQERAGRLSHFSESDIAAPLLAGDVVAWSLGGRFVTAAEKGPARCSRLHVEQFRAGENRREFSGNACGDLVELARSDTAVHVGMMSGGRWRIASVTGRRISPYLTGQMLLAAGDRVGILVAAADCADVPPGRSDTRTCGGVGYATEGPFPPMTVVPIPYGADDGTRLIPETFLGWSRDRATAYVLGSYGGVRGVYSLPFPIDEPVVPTLVITSLATDVWLTQSYQGDLYLARDGALLLVRESGEEVPLRLPDGAAVPDGPILWMAAPGGT